MKYTKEEKCLIWLDSFLGLEYRHKSQLYKAFINATSIKDEIEKNRNYIITNIGETEYKTIYNSANQIYFDYLLQALDSKNIVAITIVSKSYPNCLKEIDLPPLVLYAKGNIDLLNGDNFAIVGSRRSLPLSIGIAKNYAKELSNCGFTLVTGIAEGIDSAVIESTLNNNGKIISVLAGGFFNIYPASNKGLFDRVTEQGLAISEQPPEVKPQPYMFPIRNRIIAGLSKGVLIASAAKKSGSLYTAEYAEEYSRELFAIPYSVGVVSGEGCNDLIKRGAKLTDTPQDIIEFFGKQSENNVVALTPDELEIYNVLNDGEKHIEEICSVLNKKIFEITPIISILEIKGVIVKSGNNKYTVIR